MIYPIQDQTIRVFRLEDHFNVYTLHGHCGPITAAFVDHGGSGSNSGGTERDHCAGTGSQVSHPQFTAGVSLSKVGTAITASSDYSRLNNCLGI